MKKKKPVFRIAGIAMIVINAIPYLANPSSLSVVVEYAKYGGVVGVIFGLLGLFALAIIGLIFIGISVLRKE